MSISLNGFTPLLILDTRNVFFFFWTICTDAIMIDLSMWTSYVFQLLCPYCYDNSGKRGVHRQILANLLQTKILCYQVKKKIIVQIMFI